MTSPVPVVFTRRAERHVQEAGTWWKNNRAKAPGALAEELGHALRLVASQPDVGAIARNVRLPGVRRVLVRRVNYHLYSGWSSRRRGLSRSWPSGMPIVAGNRRCKRPVRAFVVCLLGRLTALPPAAADDAELVALLPQCGNQATDDLDRILAIGAPVHTVPVMAPRYAWGGSISRSTPPCRRRPRVSLTGRLTDVVAVRRRSKTLDEAARPQPTATTERVRHAARGVHSR